MRPPAAAVEVHIEELVLHGFDHLDRRGLSRLDRALRRELGRLLAAHAATDGPGQLIAGGDRPQLGLEALPVSAGASAEQLGVQVARALVQGLRAPQAPGSTQTQKGEAK